MKISRGPIFIKPSVGALTVIMGVVLLGFWVLLLPKMRILVQVRGEVKALEKDKELLEASQKKQSNDNQKGAVQAEIERVLALLPAGEEFHDLSIQVEALANSLDLTINSLSFPQGSSGVSSASLGPQTSGSGEKSTASPSPSASPSAASASMKRLRVSVNVSGSYEQIQLFTSGMTTLGRYVAIDQVEISGVGAGVAPGTVSSSPATTTTSPGNLTAQISASAYYLPATTN